MCCFASSYFNITETFSVRLSAAIENRIYLFDSVPVLLFARNHESVVVVVVVVVAIIIIIITIIIIIIIIVVVVIMMYFFLKVITSIQIWYLHILKKRRVRDKRSSFSYIRQTETKVNKMTQLYGQQQQ